MIGDDNPDNDDPTDFAFPVFLTPILHQLIMAGKSMHLLFKLGKVAQVYPGKKLHNCN